MHAGAPQPTTLSARMHALQRAAGSSASSAIQAAESDPAPSGRAATQTVDAHMHAGGLAAAAAAGVPAAPAQPVATGGLSATMDGCSTARMAAEFDARWRPDYPSVAPLVDTGGGVAKVAERGWGVAKGCTRKSGGAASGALHIPRMHAIGEEVAAHMSHMRYAIVPTFPVSMFQNCCQRSQRVCSAPGLLGP